MGKWVMRGLVVLLAAGLIAAGIAWAVEQGGLAQGVSGGHGGERLQPGSAPGGAFTPDGGGSLSGAGRLEGRGEGHGKGSAGFSGQTLGAIGIRALEIAAIVAVVVGLQALIAKVKTRRQPTSG